MQAKKNVSETEKQKIYILVGNVGFTQWFFVSLTQAFNIGGISSIL